MKLTNFIFQVWKVMECNIIIVSPQKSWKIKVMLDNVDVKARTM